MTSSITPAAAAQTTGADPNLIAQDDEQFRKEPDEFFYRLKAKVVDYFGSHSGKEVSEHSELME